MAQQSNSVSLSPSQEPALKKPKMSSADSDTDSTKPRRYKRRKIAIFFAYCGVGYQGMQKNPGAKTIEADLEEALFLSGAVPADERGQHKKYDWARSARTDKGVSAVGQVVSGKFFVDPPGLVERLNSFLSPQIRVFGFKRVTPSFSAKKFCDRRRYVYLLPLFALDPTSHRDRESVLASLGSAEELVKCGECSERGRKVVGVMGNRRDGSFVGALDSGISSDTGHVLVENDDVSNYNVVMVNGAEEGGNVGLDKSYGMDGDEIKESGMEKSAEISVLVDNERVLKDNGEEMVEDKEQGNVSLQMGDGVEGGLGTVDCVVGCEVSRKVLLNDGVMVSGGVEIKGGKEVGACLGDENGEGECSKIEGKEGEQGNLLNVGSSGVGDLEVNGEGKKEKRSEFKYGDEVRERFNRILKYYVGTHNFHNFTTRTKAEDPSAKRYILSFEANTTLMIEGIEFVKCEVVGQSFMLHQIRKMMGMAVAVMRNFAPESIFDTAFDQVVKINVPTAPEVGLYLDECMFSSYNNKWNDTHEEVSMRAYAEEAEEFKLKHIHSHIANTEHKEGSVAVWLHSLNRRNYPDLCPSEVGVELAPESNGNNVIP